MCILLPRTVARVAQTCTLGMQVRLAALVKRHGETSETGGMVPFSHRTFGEVVAGALQVCWCHISAFVLRLI
jgi:hypothetical protein